MSGPQLSFSYLSEVTDPCLHTLVPSTLKVSLLSMKFRSPIQCLAVPVWIGLYLCRFRWRENLLVVVLDAEVTVTGGLGPPLHLLVGRCSVLVHHSQLHLPEFSYMKQYHSVTSLPALSI